MCETVLPSELAILLQLMNPLFATTVQELNIFTVMQLQDTNRNESENDNKWFKTKEDRAGLYYFDN